ncbi:type II toxin-antitoxin system RelE/ParE family toxin [Raineyella sp. LH-20]|uniref:type II toxin-antitoxin system RelE/ParE family toxin n=1 Tax=Raineyella sp. LH-20 TaxID=3081204 RepID=UPI002954830F|nr:type II toxin-antitoxin system RelE/ParE family toxin [Raineyella sp. LH-20]WOP17567.1 type II toxin-antitoxin system RelE/ParE family toxin [Raineyella sp. LH-20]
MHVGLAVRVVAVVLPDGSCPFDEYIEGLPVRAKAALDSRLEMYSQVGRLRLTDQMNRVEASGQKSRGKRAGETLWEIKHADGPGRRLYGYRVGSTFVITHGSDKRHQKKLAAEVKLAQKYYEGWCSDVRQG